MFLLATNQFDLYFPLFNIHYHNPKQRKLKIKRFENFEPKSDLNHNIFYIWNFELIALQRLQQIPVAAIYGKNNVCTMDSKKISQHLASL